MSASSDLVGVLVGSAIGGVGVASAIIYTRQQVRLMRKQLDEARRVALAERTNDLMQRTIAARKTLLNFAQFREYEGVDQDIQRVGGIDLYVALRDNITAFQEAFVLRKSGLLEDEWWNSFLSGWRYFLGFPPVETVSGILEKRGLLRSDFSDFMRELRKQTGPASYP